MSKALRTAFFECLGTAVLVFVGVGSIGVSLLFGAFEGLGIAIVWGTGVALGILVSYKNCPAHLNPAVSLAFTITGDISIREMLVAWIAQTIGALIGALGVLACLWQINPARIADSTEAVLIDHHPAPGIISDISALDAGVLEMLGTGFLVFMIFVIVKYIQSAFLRAIFIGTVVTLIIIPLGPLTQAALNPARDIGPRIIAALSGQDTTAFASMGWIVAYMLGPFAGGVLGLICFKGFDLLTSKKTPSAA
jgi:glycerol uptake facilitator protein